MNKNSLREELKQIEDVRRGAGRRHSIDIVLMITIMATMSGYMGYRAIGDFAKRYKKELIKYLKIEKDRVPSFATIRRVLMSIDYQKFTEIFERWMRQYLKQNSYKWVSVDGKAIKGTKQIEEDKKLAHLVTFFSSDSKEVLIARKTATKSNEIPLVQEMLASFPLKDVIITLDALHCQTKTAKAIKDSGNEYVLQVKNNQKKIVRTN
jgi:predicted transposase YbfD/YdcC